MKEYPALYEIQRFFTSIRGFFRAHFSSLVMNNHHVTRSFREAYMRKQNAKIVVRKITKICAREDLFV
jgi:hypothetical protein